MTLTLIISLLIIGLILIVLEILIIPGAIVGTLGAGIMIFSVYQSYKVLGETGGHITFSSSVIVTALTIYFIFRYRSWERFANRDSLTGKVTTIKEGTIKIGDTGIAVTKLRPIGAALINGQRFQVSSRDKMIDPKAEITVTKIEGNKIIVKENNQTT